MQTDFDRELQSYFTDVEHLRELFKDWLAAPELPKRMLIIHGVGGVGKSSLLRMFRLHARSVRIPVALASGDEQKSAVDVLSRWADDLAACNLRLPAFSKALAQYRALLSKVEDEAAKTATTLAKEAAKTAAEVAFGLIPGFGPALSRLGGMSAEALTDWLFSRGFKKPNVDLFLDPAKKLTGDFLADVAKAAGKRRLVLMLDTFEQITTLSDWICRTAQQLPLNVLLVIAGRVVPDWERAWPGWMASARVEELKPMTEADIRELVRRYYATLRGGEPDPKQVEAIIAFARGLPMVVTSAVQLWVKYGVEDFQAVRPEVVANLVDRLMEGVPKELIPALEAAAIVRWFDQPVLRSVMGREDVREEYEELRRFPFVRPRAEGLGFHDAVREMVDENLRVHDAERHRALHERAAAYFEARLEKATGEEAERLALERLYHCIRANEETGIQLFQEIAEELVHHQAVNRLRTLLNDVNTHPVESENGRLWREYYNARLIHLQGQWFEAATVYERIGLCGQAEPKLRAYALCDWAGVLSNREIRHQPGQFEKALQISEMSLREAPELDRKLIMNYRTQSNLYMSVGNWDKAFALLDIIRKFFHDRGDKYGECSALQSIKALSALRGDWPRMYSAQKQGLNMLPKQYRYSTLYAELIASWSPAWAWTGRYAEAEQNTREGLAIAHKMGQVDIQKYLRDLGLVLALQGKFQEADVYLQKCAGLSISLGRSEFDKTILWRWEAICWLREGKPELARETLTKVISIFEKDAYIPAMGETLTWLGLACEIAHQLHIALDCYKKSLHFRGRRYFECGALAGLVRVKHALGEYAAIPLLLAEAEALAQQYEYNDHLASLRLTQGHIAWEGNAPFWENGFEAALHYYQQALIYALRYNRFLLDEVLSGRPQGTPLRPIIPECLKRGNEGRRMLIALRDWWQTGVNDIGTPRPDTISPIPEGIPLLEAERIAREREPGDGSPQRSVVEQIENALAKG